ncbi:MAG: hypothetical protein LBR71_07440 [Synergistaceae bacterium]|jgi:hypothetical protein|nr:hypothetical protein [Synergistaceae bacterium]
MRTAKRKTVSWSFPGLATRLLFLFFLFFRPGIPAFSAGTADTSLWTWDVLVIPPDEGWQNEQGLSIQRTLQWHETEISESGDGIRGHDLRFVFLPPLTEDSARSFVLPPAPHAVAVMSFASNPVDRELVGRVAGSGLPLLLAGGEGVFPFERGKSGQGKVLPHLFALDLFQDYRCRAFLDYASKIAEKNSRLGIIGARFTLNEEREAKICFDLFSGAGFMPMPYWADASVTDSFGMVEQEIVDYSNGILISYIGGMGAKEIWRGIMGHQSPYRIWYGGAPDKSFLSYKGMIFADQNMYLDARGGFESLKRDLWSSRTLSVPDKVAAGRANALALWLTQALKALPGALERVDRGALFSLLAEARGIPFGGQTLNIDRETHRPEKRRVCILEIRNRSFFVLDTLDARGLKYYDN